MTLTVGEAFDNYLSDPVWESGKTDDGTKFVNVTGGISYLNENAEFAVQFVVDEESERFNYNTCEIARVPQNDYFVLQLLDAIYSDGSSPTGADSAGTSTAENRIIIGETQSYNNDYGNMKVTLDYVEFTDWIPNGFNSVPDEGSIFLTAAVTVENIGTSSGSLLTVWNTLVYDEVYEYRHHSISGDITGDLAPLTGAVIGTITFMVPIEVMESEKSLIFNINDGAMQSVISFMVRQCSGVTGSNEEPSGSPSIGMNSSGFCYNGVPLISLLGCAPAELYNFFGAPTSGTPVDGSMYEGEEYYGYDEITFVIDYQTTQIAWIIVSPDAIQFNGGSLGRTRDELVAVLGNPTYEDTFHDELGNSEDYYYMHYFVTNGVTLQITMPDIYSAANSFVLARYTDGI